MQLGRHIAVAISIVLCYSACGSSKGDRVGAEFDTLIKSNSSFAIKVTAFSENNSFLQPVAGAYYRFESKKAGESAWTRVIQVHHDDPLPIEPESVVIIDSSTAYIFKSRNFAVTRDAGITWNHWEAIKDSPKKNGLCSIRSVNLSPDGRGEMVVECSAVIDSVTYSTGDFGATWNYE